MAWDYKGDNNNKLTAEFKKQFFKKMKGGTECIISSGLKVLAHEKKIKALTTSILQYPDKENGGVCIVQANLVGYDWNPATEKIDEVCFSAIGDANTANTGMVAQHYIRMAETRAVSRVLKNYTNVDVVSQEELELIVDDVENVKVANGYNNNYRNGNGNNNWNRSNSNNNYNRSQNGHQNNAEQQKTDKQDPKVAAEIKNVLGPLMKKYNITNEEGKQIKSNLFGDIKYVDLTMEQIEKLKEAFIQSRK